MRHDFLVVGGGIGGASIGYFLAGFGSVSVLEMEAVPGYHSTGRSAGLFSDCYGNNVVRALTAASREFYLDPPSGFVRPLVTERGALTLCPHGAEEQFAEMLAAGLAAPVPARELGIEETLRYCPAVRPEWFSRAMLRPAMDIDVHSLHQGFLRGIRARGGTVIRSARIKSLTARGGWHADTNAGQFSAGCVVNAGGAWADGIADLAGVRRIGLTPRRRTAAIVEPQSGIDFAGWPLVTDISDTFYFKPEAGLLLLSPADATPMPPSDVRPDDLDVALAIDRVQAATTLVIRRVKRAWAGLRSAVPDDTPVVGQAPDAAGFFWLAALSGYGIQTAPAVGRLGAALVTGEEPRDLKNEFGFDMRAITPERFY